MTKRLFATSLCLLALSAVGCPHSDLNPGRCNSTSDCPSGQTCDLSPQANGTCVCNSSGCAGSGTGGTAGSAGATAGQGGGAVGGGAGQGCQSSAQCAAPMSICMAGSCVQCATSSDCSDPTRPICNVTTNTCQACTSDQQCVAKMTGSDPGVCMSHVDGHCATAPETIYVVNDTSTCVPASAVLATGDPGKGTLTTPLCTMEQVPGLLSSGTTTRDLVVVRGTVSGGDWTFTGQGGVTLSIIGQQNGRIAAGAYPGFGISGGSAYLRDLQLSPGGSTGIAATGGTVTLEHVTVNGCTAGGILLDGAAFDIENTTVTSNGPGQQPVAWGGVLVHSLPTAGPAVLRLVTIQNNMGPGLYCSPGNGIQGDGVLASGNSTLDIASACGVSTCGAMSSTCGAQ